MSTIALPRGVPRSTVAVVAVGVLAVAGLLAQRAAGTDGWLTDPIAGTSWVAGAVLADLARVRLADAGRRRAAWYAGALAVALLAGPLAAAAAIAAAPGGGPAASVAVAVWSVTWIPPLVLAQLVASSSVRADGRRSVAHGIVLAAGAAGMLAGALLWRPTDPFAGVATVAPESWPTAIAVVGDVVTVVGLAALLVLPATLLRAALTSRDRSRTRLALAAAGTAAGPLVVACCILLAVARDPGAVDPTAGSVAFQVAVAAGASGAALCAVLAGRGAVDEARLAVGLRLAALAAGALLIAAVGTLVAASDLPPLSIALLVAGLAVGVVALAWWAGGRLARALATDMRMPDPDADAAPDADADPRPAATRSADPRLAALTEREAEVLGLLADGSSNAGIAAQLVVSERTVDAHLRSVFTKLELHADPGANRRVQAARAWADERSGEKSIRAE